MSKEPKQHAPDSPPTPAPEPTPAVKWSFGESPGTFMPRNLRFGANEAKTQHQADGTFRRAVNAPLPIAPDRQADLLARGRAAVATLDLGVVPALLDERRKLQELLDLCGAKAAEVRKRQSDPALLAALDFSVKVEGMAAELEVIEARRAEAQAALGRVNSRLTTAAALARVAIRDAVRPAAAGEQANLDGRRASLMNRISELASPLFEELFSLEQAAAPPVEEITTQLLTECGL